MFRLPVVGIARFIAFVATALLILLLISFIFASQFVFTTIGYVVGSLANRSGVSIFLVRSLVILSTIPFFWAVAQFTRSIFGLIALGWNPVAFYKNKYGVIIVTYVAVFYGAMYWASQDAYAYKLCADTPEGISVSDQAGKEPVYGTEFKPCTVAQIEVLRHSSGKLSAPQEIKIASPGDYEWFDVAGRPLVWYALESDGSYRFFDHAGINPRTGNALQPVTEGVIQQLKQQRAAQEASKQVAVTQRAAEETRTQQKTEVRDLATQARNQFDAKDYRGAFESCSRIPPGLHSPECATIRQHASVKLAQQLVNQGQSQLENGDLDEAIWTAEQAIKLDPANRTATKLKLLAVQLKARSPN